MRRLREERSRSYRLSCAARADSVSAGYPVPLLYQEYPARLARCPLALNLSRHGQSRHARRDALSAVDACQAEQACKARCPAGEMPCRPAGEMPCWPWMHAAQQAAVDACPPEPGWSNRPARSRHVITHRHVPFLSGSRHRHVAPYGATRPMLHSEEQNAIAPHTATRAHPFSTHCDKAPSF
jgi:hypothetical protein